MTQAPPKNVSDPYDIPNTNAYGQGYGSLNQDSMTKSFGGDPSLGREQMYMENPQKQQQNQGQPQQQQYQGQPQHQQQYQGQSQQQQQWQPQPPQGQYPNMQQPNMTFNIENSNSNQSENALKRRLTRSVCVLACLICIIGSLVAATGIQSFQAELTICGRPSLCLVLPGTKAALLYSREYKLAVCVCIPSLQCTDKETTPAKLFNVGQNKALKTAVTFLKQKLGSSGYQNIKIGVVCSEVYQSIYIATGITPDTVKAVFALNLICLIMYYSVCCCQFIWK